MGAHVDEIRARARLLLAADKWRDLTQLLEQDVPVGVDAAGEQRRRHLARLRRQLARVLPDGDGVQIDDAEDAFVIALQSHPVAQRPEVIAERGDARGLDAGKDALHGTCP